MITTKIQIRYTDIDTQLHVNNVNVQQYFDIGKYEYLKEVIGIVGAFEGTGIAAVNTNTNYFCPIFLQEQIEVTTKITKLGTKSFTLYQQIIDSQTQEVKSESTSVLVTIDIATQSGIEIPSLWRERVAKFENI